jgi:hypothetical protein
MNDKKNYIVKTWVFCVIASLISLVFFQPIFSMWFLWIALCIMSGSYSWYDWASTNYENAMKEAADKKINGEKAQKIAVDLLKTLETPRAIKPKKEFEERKIMIDCSCGTEAIIAITDNDWLIGQVELAFWKYGHNANLSGFSNKLRQIWNIIKVGHPYADMVILETDQIDKLIAFLNSVKEEQKEEELRKEAIAIVNELKDLKAKME